MSDAAAIATPHDGGGASARGWTALTLRLGTALVAYAILEWWLLGVAQIPEDAYDGRAFSPWLLRSLVVADGSFTFGVARLMASAGFATLLIRYRRRFWIPWSRIDAFRYVRPPVLVISAVLAWSYATYPYNAYFDQAHLIDRALLVCCALLVLWRPVFVLPLVLISTAAINQFTHPIGPYSNAEQIALVRILIMFAAMLTLRAVTGGSWSKEFVMLAICAIAASYLRCGIGKLQLGWSSHGPFNWVSHGHIYYAMFTTYANGWLGFLEADALTRMVEKIARFDRLMLVGTLVVECGALFALWRRGVLLFFLAGWAVFHLAVLGLTGIFFWKWIAVDLTLFFVFLSKSGATALPIFSRRHFALSLPVIIGGLVWFEPVNLAWYDSPATYTYRLVGIGESGARYELPPSYFAPYDYQFTMGGFHYLSDRPSLPITWGATTDRETVNELLLTETLEDVESVEAGRGRIRFDQRRADRLAGFIRRFVAVRNARGSSSGMLGLVEAPPQLLTFPRKPEDPGEPIQHVVIEQVTSLFVGPRYREIRAREVWRVDVPRQRSAA